MERLESGRLILRGWEQRDLGDFYEYAKTPNVGPNAGWKPHSNIGESQTILNRFIEQDNVWAIEHKPTGKVIGSFGLSDDSKRTNPNVKMIGYSLSEDFWGQGLMPEAVALVLDYLFNRLNLDLVSVYHFTFNTRSRRVIEKCGFTQEGIMRRAALNYDGSVLDGVCWSMTKEEYEAR